MRQIINISRLRTRLVSLQELTKRELAIQKPKLHLNDYHIEIWGIQKNHGTKKTEIHQIVKKDLGNKVPQHNYTNDVHDDFKDPDQLRKARKRHNEDPETKEKQIESITNILKSNNKSFARRVLKAIKNDVKNDPSKTNRELASYIDKRD